MLYQENLISEQLYAGTPAKMFKESKCAVLDVLTKQFGEKKIYGGWHSKDACVQYDKETSLEKAYKILNMMVFNNVLRMPEIECISQEQSLAEYGNANICQYRFNLGCLFQGDKLGGFRIQQGQSRIAVVLDDFQPPLMFLVNVLCHSMIHQFVFEQGEGIDSLCQAIVKQKQYDVHDGQFKEIMDKLNKETGLLIDEKFDQVAVGYIESTYKARTMNDEYEGKEELGLYKGIEDFKEDFIEDGSSTMFEREDGYAGDDAIASLVQDALESSTHAFAAQKSRDTLQITIS